jgi:uncharacterized repeat protein (TIGR02543 family)
MIWQFYSVIGYLIIIMKKSFIMVALIATALAQLNAAIIQLDLRGTAGYGLLFGNEPSVPSGGSGGEIGAGIFYDDVTKLLTINAGWGSSQGFTDLSSLSTASHIHGPTAAANGSGFTQVAGVIFTLARSSSAVTGGYFTTPPITLTLAQETDLLNGKYYINVHTANYGGGEIRGFLVPAITNCTLTVTTNGFGSISPSGGTYPSGSNVVLTATANAGYAFTGWSGAVTGTNNPLTVAMTSNKALTGNFAFATNSVPTAIALTAQISWLASNGVNYQVQAAAVLNSNVWVNLGGQIVGNGSTNYYYDPVGNLQSRFYRVMTRP